MQFNLILNFTMKFNYSGMKKLKIEVMNGYGPMTTSWLSGSNQNKYGHYQ